MKKKRNINSSSYPIPDGHPTRHRPRRNYWGNLYDEDTFDEACKKAKVNNIDKNNIDDRTLARAIFYHEGLKLIKNEFN